MLTQDTFRHAPTAAFILQWMRTLLGQAAKKDFSCSTLKKPQTTDAGQIESKANH